MDYLPKSFLFGFVLEESELYFFTNSFMILL